MREADQSQVVPGPLTRIASTLFASVVRATRSTSSYSERTKMRELSNPQTLGMVLGVFFFYNRSDSRGRVGKGFKHSSSWSVLDLESVGLCRYVGILELCETSPRVYASSWV